MSRAALAEMAGTTVKYISHLENGAKGNPSATLVENLARALQCEVADLMGGGSPATPPRL